MRVGILTQNFTGLSGANDFLKHIIFSLQSVARNQKLELFILLDILNYRRHKGVKRFFAKQREMRQARSIFKEFKNIKFIYSTSPANAILKNNLDVVLPYTGTEPLGVKTVAYLYDCQHRHLPEFFSEEVIKARDEFFQDMVDSRQKIIVNAETVKDDLVNFFKASPEQICVLPYTPKIDLCYYKDYSRQIKKYHLPKRYIMMSNQFWIHKDHPTAFRAFAEYLKTDADMEFIFTGAMEDGRRPEYIRELKDLLKELNIEDKVRFLGLIPKEEQLQIMKGATAVIQTTLFEGGPGGGSVYDAAALGVPVVVSDIKTNLGVVYDRILYFRAGDAQDLCAQMRSIVAKAYMPIPVCDLIAKSQTNMETLGNYLANLIKEV